MPFGVGYGSGTAKGGMGAAPGTPGVFGGTAYTPGWGGGPSQYPGFGGASPMVPGGFQYGGGASGTFGQPNYRYGQTAAGILPGEWEGQPQGNLPGRGTIGPHNLQAMERREAFLDRSSANPFLALLARRYGRRAI